MSDEWTDRDEIQALIEYALSQGNVTEVKICVCGDCKKWMTVTEAKKFALDLLRSASLIDDHPPPPD